MTGGPLTEDDVRAHLHTALDEVSATPRPFNELHRAVTVRRRQRRGAGAVVTAAVLGVGIAGGLSAVGGHDHRRGAVIEPIEPKVDPAVALRNYVTANNGTSPTAVIGGADGGTYAADIEAGKVQVLSFDGHVWSSVVQLGAPLPGPPVIAAHRGPDGAGSAAAFQVDEAGGDAVFNGVVVNVGGEWRYANFDCGSTDVACAAGAGKVTTYEYDATEVDHAFHSEAKVCTPSCVAGARYDVTWRWDAASGGFVVDSAVKMH